MPRERTSHVFGKMISIKLVEGQFIITLERGFTFRANPNALPRYIKDTPDIKFLIDFSSTNNKGRDYMVYLFYQNHYRTYLYLAEQDIVAEDVVCS